MKKILLCCAALAFCLSSGAQTTAADFVKNDCAGRNHHLFAELDSGYVCVIDFIMFGCQPCVTGTDALKAIHAQFEASHPGKVRFYSMGFLSSMTCNQMDNWKNANKYTHTVFSGETEQVNYYGGMGMPTIVILGGLAEHKVYYNHQGYSTGENTPIINAINLAISESNTSATSQLPGDKQFSVFPNPFDNAITVDLQSVQATHLILTDMAGLEVLRSPLSLEPGRTEITLPAGQLRPGIYFIGLLDGERRIGFQKLVKE